MKKIILISVLIGTMLIMAISPNTANAVAFSPWVGMTGSGKVAITPTFYIPTSFDSVTLDIIGGYGITDNIDLQLNLSTITFSSSGVEWGGAWVMPRYDFGQLSILDYNIIALQLGYSSEFSGSIQYHTMLNILPSTIFIELNLSASLSSFSSIIALVLKPLEFLSLYVEFDPSISYSGDFSYSVIPGIDINLGSGGEINLGYDLGSSQIVGWYSISF
jgi:hypothetical protein